MAETVGRWPLGKPSGHAVAYQEPDLRAEAEARIERMARAIATVVHTKLRSPNVATQVELDWQNWVGEARAAEAAR